MRRIELWPLRPGVARVGMGPILRIGKNQKAPTIQRPPVRVVPIGKLFEKIRLPARLARVNSGRHLLNSSSSGFGPTDVAAVRG
jgi:hypothetical protein